MPFARSIGVLKALLIFAVKTLFSDRLSRLIICFFPTAVFLNLLYLPSWRNHRTRRVHGGHLVEARGVDSRLRARSGATLTVPRTVIHFRPVRLPPDKKPPHTQGARRSFGGGEGSRFSPAGSVRGGSDSPPDCHSLPPRSTPPHIKNHRTRKVHGGHLVEARGVEPLSEDGLIGLSPGADDC